MNKSLYIILVLSVYLLGQGCKREDRLDHIDNNAPAPENVSGVKVMNTPGGAIITYKLSADVNLSYVKAVFEQGSEIVETKSSLFTDTIKIQGLGDTSVHVVKLYSVGKNEKNSTAISVNIKPLLPPVKSVFKTLKLEAGFSGVKVSMINPLEADLALVIEADTTIKGDTTKKVVYRPLRTFYSKTTAGTFSVRGLSSTEAKFRVYLRDRWGNRSDTLTQTLTPIFEKLVPKPFSLLSLPTDTNIPASTNVIANIWDGKVDLNIFASGNGTPIPQWFTFDLKIPVVLSRMKEHQRTPPYAYTGACVKSFELWGSNSPALDGTWASWTLIGTFNSFKPSGSPGTVVTTEDNTYGYTNGEDFDMPDIPSPPAYRYLRFKTTETWGGTGQVTIAELTFWGKF